MPRAPRITVPGTAYHVLNRRVMRMKLFQKPGDYLAFERILKLALARPDAPALLAWCLMPNHWHLVLLARAATHLSTWMQWLTVTHTHRWHQHYHGVGHGPLYQGRFKSFPIQEDVVRYVEANALRAKLVEDAAHWRWGSLRARIQRAAAQARLLSPLPMDLPPDWPGLVNEAQAGLDEVRQSVVRGTPFGEDRWADRVAAAMGLSNTRRQRGRPRKNMKKHHF